MLTSSNSSPDLISALVLKFPEPKLWEALIKSCSGFRKRNTKKEETIAKRIPNIDEITRLWVSSKEAMGNNIEIIVTKIIFNSRTEDIVISVTEPKTGINPSQYRVPDLDR